GDGVPADRDCHVSSSFCARNLSHGFFFWPASFSFSPAFSRPSPAFSSARRTAALSRAFSAPFLSFSPAFWRSVLSSSPDVFVFAFASAVSTLYVPSACFFMQPDAASATVRVSTKLIFRMRSRRAKDEPLAAPCEEMWGGIHPARAD